MAEFGTQWSLGLNMVSPVSILSHPAGLRCEKNTLKDNYFLMDKITAHQLKRERDGASKLILSPATPTASLLNC